MMDLPTSAADLGVAVKANAENATADAVVFLPRLARSYANSLWHQALSAYR
jgi:hypothetical protein